MNINFSKVIKPPIIAASVVIVLFAIYMAIWIFYPEKTDISQKISDLDRPEKKECLENFSKMSEDEFFENIKEENFENSKKSGRVEMTPIYKEISKYLVCRLEFLKDENFYNKTKELVMNMDIQEKNKQVVLGELEEAYSKNYKFNYLLANGDLGTICPKILPSLCLSSPDENFPDFEINARTVAKTKEGIKSRWCNNICEIITTNKEQPEKFLNNAILNQNWQTDIGLLRNQYEWRVAMAYRIQGMEMAKKVCEQIPVNAEKERCFEYIDSFGLQKCHITAEKISSLICQ